MHASDASISQLSKVAPDFIDRLADAVQHAEKLLHGGSRVFGHQHLRSPYLGHREFLERAIDGIRVIADGLARSRDLLLILLVSTNELLDEFRPEGRALVI